jgi:hypothetical protein
VADSPPPHTVAQASIADGIPPRSVTVSKRHRTHELIEARTESDTHNATADSRALQDTHAPGRQHVQCAQALMGGGRA